MKKKLRIGKDFGLTWAIKAKNAEANAPYEPSSDSMLLLVTPYNKVQAEGAVFDGNKVRWVFRGKDQKHLGDYGLELVENRGKNGMVTIDTCEAFELVAHTCEETGYDGEDVIFDTLEFITEVELNALRGPQGEQGPVGPQGEQGPVGPAGPSYDDTEIQNKLTELEDEVASNGVLIEDLQNMKIDKENDDYYPNMAVGLADNLAGVDVVDSEINFRRSGGGAISDGVARIESIKGNSVVWNQKLSPIIFTPSMNGVSYTLKDDAVIMTGVATDVSYTNICNVKVFISGHKYALTGGFTSDNSLDTYMLAVNTDGAYTAIASPDVVFVVGTNIPRGIFLTIAKGVDTNGLTVRPKLYDLTQMFGSGNEPTTIEEFYARIPMGVDINAYNEGEVIHMDVQSVESQGVNAWDEEWESGFFNIGKPIVDASRIRSKNYIRIIGGKQYYSTMRTSFFFYDKDKNYISTDYDRLTTAPANAFYMMFAVGGSMSPIVTYNHDICINISDASINGKYFPYIKRVEDLSIIRKYFPQGMKSAPTAHDEIRYNKESGKWEKVEAIGTRAYQEGDAEDATLLTDGKVTCYPLAEPIVTKLDEADQFKDLDYQVWNAGTEKAIAEGKSAPLAADITYGFNAIGKIKELESLVAALRAKVGI